MDARRQSVDELSEAQEQELVSDVRLLLVAFLVINGWGFEDILRHYRMSDTQLVRYPATPDRLKLIDLLPPNRIKLGIPPTFAWRRNSPIQQFLTPACRTVFCTAASTRAMKPLSSSQGCLPAAAPNRYASACTGRPGLSPV